MSVIPEELAKMQQQMQGPESVSDDLNSNREPNESTEMSKEEQFKFIQKASARYKLASVGMDEHHKLWNIIDKFDRGRQWDSVKIPVWVPKPITNLIRYVRTTKRANLALNIPSAHFVPMTPLDYPLIKQVQKAYNHVWDEQKVALTVRRCVDRTQLHGTAIGYVYAEENIRGKYYGKGHEGNQLYRYDVKVKRLNNATFFIDPSSYNISEAKYITIVETLAFSDVKNNPAYREYAGDRLKKLSMADLQKDANGEVGAIYERENSKDGQVETGDEMVSLHVHWERYRNEEGAWQVDVSYFLWNTDFLLYRIEDFKPSVLPFAVLYDEEEDNSFWGTSSAMDMLENQKIINKTAQAASIIGTLHQNPQKVVLRDSGINAAEMSRTGTLPGKVWTSNVPNAVETIQPPDIPKGLFEIEDRMKNDIKDMAGITEAYTGQSVGSLTTSTGVDSLIERSSIRDKDKAVQIDDFVEQLSNLIVKFILVYWTEERPIMTRKKNGTPEFETWKPVDEKVVENLEWRAVSDIYASAPVTAASRKQQADNLMQMQGQFQFDPPIITPEEWIEMQDFPNKEDILSRMEDDRANKQQQDAQALQQQILDLIGQAQAMKAEGAGDDEVNQQIQPMIDELVQQTFTSGTKQGTAGALSSSAPTGTTSPTAMGNMVSGM